MNSPALHQARPHRQVPPANGIAVYHSTPEQCFATHDAPFLNFFMWLGVPQLSLKLGRNALSPIVARGWGA